MYHGDCAPLDQERVIEHFTKSSHLRCVVATSAFGLGVQINDIRHVVHWGPAKDLLDYWQQVGRAGRDQKPSQARLYLYPWSCNKAYIDSDMLALAEDTHCIRKKVLTEMFVPGMDESDLLTEHPKCCNYCDSTKNTE